MNADPSSDPIVLSAARWFWWIAGLSLVNTVLFFSGSDTSFVVGLGLTTLTNVMLAQNLGAAIAAAAVTIGFYLVMGWMAQKERLWAFYAGLVVYALDALIFVKFEDWMPVAFHAFAIYCIAKGVMQIRARSAVAA
ncbi:hypothetical protein [Pelomonas sp. KK5]|uniref:hypothetical protein n=1 Tax=Pelomonas sp. KK5 TaxID=1855730 RepID=UPI00097BBE3D|nr:hypothetical protein [Pelomonas sp. KK5]